MKETNAERIKRMRNQVSMAARYNNKKKQSLCSTGLSKEDLAILSDDQKKALDALLKFLENDSEFLLIEGYAGTGKTFLINKFVASLKTLANTNPKMALTAPTNKAVKVLRNINAINSTEVDYVTIHGLLGLKLKLDYTNESNPVYQLYQDYDKESQYPLMDLVIIDEASMIGDELWSLIVQGKGNTKTILLGDPAQIPPVGYPEAIPLTAEGRLNFNIDYVSMKQIMRQADGNTIIPFATQLRDSRFDTTDKVIRMSSENVKFYASNDNAQKQRWASNMLATFLDPKFKADSNHCKAIAWRNKTVDLLNGIVRNALFGPESALNELMPGEKVIFDKPVFSKYGETLFTVSDEVTIESVAERSMHYVVTEQMSERIDLFGITETKGHNYYFEYYEAIVSYYDKDQYVSMTLDILKQKTAEQSFKWACSKVLGLKQWKEYEKLLRMFAFVKYNYAITAHKAQGSTYSNVFLFEDDLDMNQNIYEKNRIKYTACTRPKDSLHILTKKV